MDSCCIPHHSSLQHTGNLGLPVSHHESRSISCHFVLACFDSASQCVAKMRSIVLGPSALLPFSRCLCRLRLFKSPQCKALEIDVVHDIPVKVMPANEAAYYRPPEVQLPEVSDSRSFLRAEPLLQFSVVG